MNDARRKYGLRRDINELVRDESGKISGSKVGTYAGQIISGHLLIAHSEAVIPRWDTLAVLFLVLIAPEFYKRFMNLRYGGTSETSETSREKTTSSVTRETTK